ncbi:DUF3237 domain-containing protein [Caulobacter mirabilis]|uniref:UPF0311 protein CSW64_17970 n=1 Tax=Caulobacter mirabilis TaxID=69666 RepID=A0A2D2B1K2_9CAUL|nr:DUF3237 domain-containing protein [Caulobacter mirabilis]ATQ44139.1 hypothetical protein CSW64_17970 [Caulobacter mirabilis]
MTGNNKGLATRPLCTVDIRLEDAAPIVVGKTPWRNRRISHIAGGVFTGDRLKGVVHPGGADWSEGGANAAGDVLTLVDVRALWTTDDGAQIYVVYAGRLNIPAGALADFRDPAKVETLPDDAYYFRTLVTFETAAPRYSWLNEITAVGVGRRTIAGVRYDIAEVL